MPTEVENPWGQINHKLVELKIKHAEKELIEDANRRWAENSLPLTTPGGLTQPEWEAWLSNPSRLGDKETVSRLADIWFELLEGRTRTRQRVYGEECHRQGCAETGRFSKEVLDCNLVSLFSSSDKEFGDRLEDYVKTRNLAKDLLRRGVDRYRKKASDFHTQVEEEVEIQVQERVSAANRGGGTEEMVRVPSAVANGDNSKNRRKVIDTFITTVTDAGRKITRKDMWTVAGYKDRTEFERFQRGDKRTTSSASDAFNRVLNMNPDDFIRLLENKLTVK